MVSYSLSPLFGSNGWLTVEACSNQSVKIFGNDWNTYLFPCANERRYSSITSFDASPLRLNKQIVSLAQTQTRKQSNLLNLRFFPQRLAFLGVQNLVVVFAKIVMRFFPSDAKLADVMGCLICCGIPWVEADCFSVSLYYNIRLCLSSSISPFRQQKMCLIELARKFLHIYRQYD